MPSLRIVGGICTIFVSYRLTLDAKLNASAIAYYQFDGDLTDSSGNNHDGTVNVGGTEQYSLDNVISTQSFYFDGNTRIEVESLSGYNWDVTGYLSLSLWIKSVKTDAAQHMELINNGNYYCTSFQVRVARDYSLQCAVFTEHHENEARDGPNGRPAFGHSFKFDNTWVHDTWHHIVVTYNQHKARSKQLALYLNGKLLGMSGITDKGTGIVSHDHPLYIGHAGDECISSDDYFSGYMDEVIIFESELDGEQVSMIYEEGIATMKDNSDGIRSTDNSDEISQSKDSFSGHNYDHHRYTNHDLAVLVGVILGSVVCILLVIVGYLCWRNKKIHSEAKYVDGSVVAVPSSNNAQDNEMNEGQQAMPGTNTSGTHVRVATMSVNLIETRVE
eukprot:159754_1